MKIVEAGCYSGFYLGIPWSIQLYIKPLEAMLCHAVRVASVTPPPTPPTPPTAQRPTGKGSYPCSCPRLPLVGLCHTSAEELVDARHHKIIMLKKREETALSLSLSLIHPSIHPSHPIPSHPSIYMDWTLSIHPPIYPFNSNPQ